MKNHNNSSHYNHLVGAIVIGRNEGDRLVTCLRSLKNVLHQIVYVDSGSTDGSLEKAKQLGVRVVELDMSSPFTAARARNKGVETLLIAYPTLKWIQFIDGDCELQSDWITQATLFMESHKDYAIVCGRRRERYPSASLYNYFCDIEWNTPVGQAKSCGGDALVCVDAFLEVSGFNPSLIAGEEPEMCFRLRQKGWKIYRLDEEMSLHDANITSIFQWWKRSVRAGYAYACVSSLHMKSDEKLWQKEVRRAYFWGGVLPVLISVLFFLNTTLATLLLMLYVALFFKIYLSLGKHFTNKFAWSSSLIFTKFAEAKGAFTYKLKKIFNKAETLIEYK